VFGFLPGEVALVYTGTRTDTTQQTNICLEIHRQTCLSGLLPTEILPFQNLLTVGMWTSHVMHVWWWYRRIFDDGQ